MSPPERHPDWIEPDVDLTEIDGNAFAVMGAVRKALRRAGNSPEVIQAYSDAATSGDYDRLLTVSMLYVGDLEEES